jgi:chaperone BCS1
LNSSLSFAIAGYFKLKIYIVSLNSPAMNEENLGTLFTELPKQCVVLLEDIDTAGLTHDRDSSKLEAQGKMNTEIAVTKPTTTPPGAMANGPNSTANNNGGRISLSALLNIIDGVAATEGSTAFLPSLFYVY